MNQHPIPVFENGKAQPVFPYTSGKTESYDPAASAVVRYCVYIESDYDLDGDGRRDRVKAFVQVPRSAAEGAYKAATLYEPRPYCSGVNEDGYEHMKEVEEGNFGPFDLSELDREVPAAVPDKRAGTMETALQAKVSDWYFPYSGNHNACCYESIDLYDYYLIRGFAVVLSSGFGTYGSDGMETAGSHYERDGFKTVVEWLHGDRIAYTDRTGTTEIRADWSNGKVAMTGRSYAGTMPFAVATTGVAGLETIVPVAGIADWYSQQNMQGSQRYWPKEALNSFLAYYCTSRYGEPGLSLELKDRLDRYLNQMSLEQLKTGCDYSDFWKDGSYYLQADQLKCSALIVHGLHDENVSTKQFELMLKAFEKAGQNVRLLLHQGPHITPSMPPKHYGLAIDGTYYDEIVNEWLCHYLYGVENGAENRPAVLVQSNLDQHQWIPMDAWETGMAQKLSSADRGTVRLNTDWNVAGVTPENYDEKMSLFSTGMNQRYQTENLEQPLTLQGSTCVKFRAALTGGDPEADFHPSNPNDADLMTMKLATAAGKMDDLKLCFLLCDVADEAFDHIATSDPQRNLVPMKTVLKDGIALGGALDPLDLAEFDTVHTPFNVISRAYLDLCNPASGYDPTTAAASVNLKMGEAHDYTVFLNASRYTLEAGHRLMLVVTTEDPINCLIHKEYEVSLQEETLEMLLPVTEVSGQMLQLNRC